MNRVFNDVAAIDGSYIMHRCMMQPNLWELRNEAGERTGGLFGFIRSLYYEIRNTNYFPVVCFDSGFSEFRLNIYEDYKNAREKIEQSMLEEEVDEDEDYLTQYRRQRDIVITLLSYLGIPAIKVKNWEGDDLITLLTRLSNRCVVMTDDWDMVQLLDDNVYVRRPLNKEDWHLENFLKEFDYDNIREFVVAKAIMGDPSDNIPSVTSGLERKYSIGKKRAKIIAKIIIRNPDNYIDVLENMDDNYVQGFLMRLDDFERNLKLIDLNYVPNDNNVIKKIEAEVYGRVQQSNFFKAVSLIREYDILDINSEEIISTMHMLSHNLKQEGE